MSGWQSVTTSMGGGPFKDRQMHFPAEQKLRLVLKQDENFGMKNIKLSDWITQTRPAISCVDGDVVLPHAYLTVAAYWRICAHIINLFATLCRNSE